MNNSDDLEDEGLAEEIKVTDATTETRKKRGRPRKVVGVPSPQPTPTVELTPPVAPTPPTNGIPPACKRLKMKNGVIKPDEIFLFVSRESIPAKFLHRFLELCDTQIISLGPETLNRSDLEEIALMYRERIYLDIIYQSLGETSDEGITDSALIQQIVKLGTQEEARKSNLAIRFKDKGKTRQETNDLTMMDVLGRFKENSADLEREAKLQQAIINSDIVPEGNQEKKITSTKDYMEGHLGKLSPADIKKLIKEAD